MLVRGSESRARASSLPMCGSERRTEESARGGGGGGWRDIKTEGDCTSNMQIDRSLLFYDQRLSPSRARLSVALARKVRPRRRWALSRSLTLLQPRKSLSKEQKLPDAFLGFDLTISAFSLYPLAPWIIISLSFYARRLRLSLELASTRASPGDYRGDESDYFFLFLL